MNTKKYFIEIFKKGEEQNEKQDSVIDAIRALSVLSIIAFHVMIGVIQVYDHSKAKQFILGMPSLLQPLWHGEKGVDAFFLLSALVIGLPFFKNIDNYNLSTAKEFLKKKFFRIYPLFLVALILYTLGQWSYFGEYFFSNLFFLNNIIPGERTIIPVGWFLTVEVQYFILLPILFFALKKIRLQKTKYIGIVLSTLFVSSVVACALVLLSNSDLYLRPITDLFLAEDRNDFSARMGRFFYEANLTRYGPFVAGILLAYLKIFHSEKLASILKNKFIGILFFFAAAAMILFPILLPIYDPDSWYYNSFSAGQNFWVLAASRQIFALGLVLLILGCWYSLALPFALIKKIFSWRVWRPISKLSFPIYLFHFPFIAIAAAAVFGTTNIKEIAAVSFLSGSLIFCLAFALTFIFSIPLYIYIERPIIERTKNSAKI